MSTGCGHAAFGHGGADRRTNIVLDPSRLQFLHMDPAPEHAEPRGLDAAGTIGDVIRHWARATPEAPAMAAVSRQPMSYRGLAALVDRLARQLDAAGVGRGSRLAVVHRGGAEMLTTVLGIVNHATALPVSAVHLVETAGQAVRKCTAQRRHALPLARPACHRCQTSTRGALVRAKGRRASPVASARRTTGGGTFVPYLAGRPSWWDRGARGQTKAGRRVSARAARRRQRGQLNSRPSRPKVSITSSLSQSTPLRYSSISRSSKTRPREMVALSEARSRIA